MSHTNLHVLLVELAAVAVWHPAMSGSSTGSDESLDPRIDTRSHALEAKLDARDERFTTIETKIDQASTA